MNRLQVIPCDLDEANAFIEKHHRHHKPLSFHKFSIAAYDGSSIVGVCVVNRPVSRVLDNGLTLEVCRLATDGTKNACSFLYGAAARASFSLGYKKIITYILNTEPGISLSASGWKIIGECGGRSWSCKSRPRIDKHPIQKKIRFEKERTTAAPGEKEKEKEVK